MTPWKRITSLGLEALEAREVPALVGGLDPSFGTGGLAAFNLGGGDATTAVVADPGGRVLVAGITPGPGGNDFLVERVNPDGTLDTTFGLGGRAIIDFAGADDQARCISLDPAGNVLVAGRTTPGPDDLIAITRLTPSGAIDVSFGTGGRIVIPGGAGTDVVAQSAFVDGTGNVVAAVTTTSAGVSQFALGRVTPAGAFDVSFGTGGKTSFSFGAGTSDTMSRAVRDPSGNIVVAGVSVLGAVGKFAVARLTPSGLLDATFGAGGKVAFNLTAGSSDGVSGVATDPAGRVVVVGRSAVGMATQFGVARLTTTGGLDPSFAGGGVLRTGVGAVVNAASDVVIQPSGRLVVGGSVMVPGGDFAVIRLNPDGSPDPTFNAAGPVPGQITIDFAGGSDVLRAMTASIDGRIVCVGYDGVPPLGIKLARLIGSVEAGQRLAAGGSTNGQASVFAPSFATGQYAPAGTVSGFAGLGVNARTAVGDVNGDGAPDTVLVTGPGTPIRVAVVSGKDNTTALVPAFDPFGGDFTGGGFLAVGDFDHDGRAEFVVSPDQGGGPRVTIFSLPPSGAGPTVRANFFGIDDPAFRGGARVAAGDINGDGVADVAVAAGFLGGPRVSLYDGKTLFSGTPVRLVGDFFGFPGSDAVTLRNGVFLAVGDVSGDGKADLILGGGPGGAPRVFILSGSLLSANDVSGAQAAPVANFFVAGDSADRGGVRVAATDADGDHRAEVVAGSGENRPSRARVYLGKNFAGSSEPATFQDLDPFGAALPGGVFVG